MLLPFDVLSLSLFPCEDKNKEEQETTLCRHGENNK
jgi:hypothetical protein